MTLFLLKWHKVTSSGVVGWVRIFQTGVSAALRPLRWSEVTWPESSRNGAEPSFSLKHTNCGNRSDEEPCWIHILVGAPRSWSPDWVYCFSRTTSLPVLIVTCSKTNRKQLGGDAWTGSRSGSTLVWIWFGSAQWEPSLNSFVICRCGSGFLMLGRSIQQGAQQILGFNRKHEQTVESILYICSKWYLYNTNIHSLHRLRNMNRTRPHDQKLLVAVDVLFSSCGFVIYNSRFDHLHIDSLYWTSKVPHPQPPAPPPPSPRPLTLQTDRSVALWVGCRRPTLCSLRRLLWKKNKDKQKKQEEI